MSANQFRFFVSRLSRRAAPVVSALALGVGCGLLLAIAADDKVDVVPVRQIVWTPVGYAASLAVILLGYYELHSVLFGTSLT